VSDPGLRDRRQILFEDIAVLTGDNGISEDSASLEQSVVMCRDSNRHSIRMNQTVSRLIIVRQTEIQPKTKHEKCIDCYFRPHKTECRTVTREATDLPLKSE
jgi:chaperonin GroEL (HSP60 family)